MTKTGRRFAHAGEAGAPALAKAMKLIRTRGAYGDAQGRAVVDGGHRKIPRQTIRSLFDRRLAEWPRIEPHRIVPTD